jgi:hypothetical protein
MRVSRYAVALVAGVLCLLAAPAVARADVFTDWNVLATSTILAPNPTAHGSTISFAMVQGAVYDAVNAIDRGHEPYLLDVDAVGAQPFDSQDAAVATAAYLVLADLMPAQQATLEAAWKTSLGPEPYSASTQGGIAAGEAAAEAMLAARQNDGRGAPFTFVIGPDPGDWRPLLNAFGQPILEPAAWVGNVKPFLIERPDQFRSDGPNSLTSAAYAEDFDEVKELGSLTSAKRTADQTMAAVFWQAQPGALWNRMLRDVAAGEQLNTASRARLFGAAWLAAADGAISCWNDKYYWNFWRPEPAIREAGTDGNPDTVADPTWLPLFQPSVGAGLSTPAFPEHPSGHGCVSGALLNATQDILGTDKVAFDVHSSRFPGQPRHFDMLSQATKEIIDARVWGGIHFRTADVQGVVIGKKVAHYLRKHYLQPVG